jgi:hypothetical protein
VAIYLGEFMPENEKIKLIELAAAKEIEVHVMKSNYSRSKNYLESLKLKIEREKSGGIKGLYEPT